ncbi:hypothetical protein BC936DRAFT_148042 [Jimgerdemannia flammicorona]|uniref:Methyltransferase type 11 domain-containing protein n=1 Tax=Jimgerdemannia flammicorona TaxID=994334 RepID=A0A433DKY9_9FUNG|nr:hypothetical protein BC936DRAFT_148042 [Jimgerdemannia flammicorona]
MGTSYTPEDWSRAAVDLYRVTRPGGWMEIFETDFDLQRMPQNYAIFYSAMADVAKSRGIDMTMPRRLSEILPPTLVEVESDFVSCPIGWQGRLGDMTLTSFDAVMRGMQPMVEPLINVENYDYFVSRIEIEFRSCKTWAKVPYAFGMKPLE